MIFGRSSGEAPRSATQTIMTLVIAGTPIITATVQTPKDCDRPSHINLISDIKHTSPEARLPVGVCASASAIRPGQLQLYRVNSSG